MKKYVIIAAGGMGARMKTAAPKQFLLIGGKPVLMHTVFAFCRYDKSVKIILALPGNEISKWKKLCNKYSFRISHTIVRGGTTRFHSVKNALALINDKDSLIAVHDGVRPLVKKQTIKAAFNCALRHGSAIPAVPLSNSIRKIKGNRSFSSDRLQFVSVQTPQCFKGEILKKAYKQKYRAVFTDDASVVEKAGFKVKLMLGDEENIKITTPMDLKIAGALLR